MGEVLDTVPPLPGEEALYGQFRVLLDAAQKDPAIKKALVEVASETERDVIDPFLQWKHNGRPAGNGWNRSTNNARFGTDYFNRTGTAKSNMFDNPPEETQYFYTDDNSGGAPLDGKIGYKITFPAGALPPVNGFPSLTLYNEHHFFSPNALNRYSLGTKNKNMKLNEDGSLTLYARAQSPGADREFELAACTGWTVLTLRPRLLGQRANSRRLVETTGHRENSMRLSATQQEKGERHESRSPVWLPSRHCSSCPRNHASRLRALAGKFDDDGRRLHYGSAFAGGQCQLVIE